MNIIHVQGLQFVWHGGIFSRLTVNRTKFIQDRAMSQTVVTETHGAVHIVTINRPERRNAVNRDAAIALFEAFKAFDADDSLSVGILTGAGGAFCAGADLKALSENDRPANLSDAGHDTLAPMGPTRLRLSKPVIAAVEGHAVAGGMELALWCDLRVMAEDATMGIFCRRFGVPLVDLGTVRLPRLIGHARAMDLILTGRPIGAVEALNLGVANRVVPAGTALNAAIALANEIAVFPQACMRNDRMSAIEQWDLSEDDAIRRELHHGRASVASGETHLGASTFAGGTGRHGSFDFLNKGA
jgi:enoyl-CoA hydratase